MIAAPNIELVLLDKPGCASDYYDISCDQCGPIAGDVRDEWNANLVRANHLTEHHTEMILELSEKLQQLKESIVFGQTDNWKPNG